METAIIIFHIHKEHRTVDLEVPLDLTAKELAAALNEAYGLGVDLSDINNCYLKAQNPIMLLKGNRTLKEFGVRNGTIISMAEVRRKREESYQISLPAAKAAADKEAGNGRGKIWRTDIRLYFREIRFIKKQNFRLIWNGLR